MSASDTTFGAIRDPGEAATAQRRAREAARRHSRVVKTLRVLLPLGGVAIVVVIFGMAVVKSLLPVDVIGNLDVTSEGLVMNDPNLAGRLNDGRAYNVSAGKAVQSFTDTSRITLTDMLATLIVSDAQTVEMRSKGGLLDTDDEWMNLTDGVVLTTTDGYRADLEDARLDFKAGTLASDAPIKIQSEKFDLTANALDVTDEGKVVRFVGNVNMTIHGKPESNR
ncbi:LPS export ABC transporter periplasmic protein LptC [Amorphus coralli]|uniref:LPS export ABC transporter periplasmic protein LptC n=1 Tax=Amorphus coralli TaxID=340680 RepID=UPI00037F4AF0|nr:LPS export ABC transporter periplasmic protein LptC [Amorphus coralli]